MSVGRAVELQERSWRLQAEGKLDEAADACREALRLMEDAEGPRSPDVANLLNDLAEIECDRQDLPLALALAERAHSIEDDLGDDFTGETAVRIRVRTLAIRGAVHRARGDCARADGDLQQALARSVAAFGDGSQEAAEARNNLAVLYKYWGRFDEGVRLYGRALEAIVAIHGEDSLDAGTVHHNIGGILHARGDFAAAEPPARKAWEISRRHLGGDDPRTMADSAQYAAILDGLKRYDESEPIYRRALTIFEAAFGSDHEEIGTTCHNLGALLAARGEHQEAERYYRRALAIRERLLGHEAPESALTCNNLGKLLTDVGRPGEAVPLLASAVAILERRLAPDHPHLARTRENLRQATNRLRRS